MYSNPGYYYFTEASGRPRGATYVLRSPWFDKPKGLGCQLRFAYSMYGAGMGTLQVMHSAKHEKTKLDEQDEIRSAKFIFFKYYEGKE